MVSVCESSLRIFWISTEKVKIFDTEGIFRGDVVIIKGFGDFN